jgi:YHS domain-containing protein
MKQAANIARGGRSTGSEHSGLGLPPEATVRRFFRSGAVIPTASPPRLERGTAGVPSRVAPALQHHVAGARREGGEMSRHERGVALDPICGKPVIETESENAEYKRKKYFFCSTRCRTRFERHAERIHLGELARMGALFATSGAHWGVA